MQGSQLQADLATEVAPTATELELELGAQQPSGGIGEWRVRLASALTQARWPIAVYSLTRLALAVLAIVAAGFGRRSVVYGFFRYDGQWYLRLAEHGYPTTVPHTPSTLGFLPLYPMIIRAVSAVSFTSLARAALVVSLAGGLVAAILAYRLADAWWGERVARRATLVFCLFPGTIVFSMAYSEGLTIPLALGTLLALRSKRWLLAGLLAGLATAVEPVALVLIVVCLAAAGAEIRRRGWRDRAAWRSLAAPVLSTAGIGGFAVFLWIWTGTPMATYQAQHYGWHEQGQPLALLALPVVRHVFGHPAQVAAHILAWNLWNGILGGLFLLLSIRLLVKLRSELSVGTLVLTIGVAAITLWSVMTPPNARMTLVAFPAVLVWGRRLSGRRFGLFVAVEAALFVLASVLTYSGHMLP